jgi:DNA-binding transcriptional LysR family regulator
VISETRDLARDASLLAGGETGIVRIGCTTGLQSPLLGPLLGRIVSTHPDLKVHAEAASGARLIPLLDSRDLDVVFTGSAPDRDAYVAETILEAPSIFVASPWHPLANERNVPTARLAQFKCGGSHSPGSSNPRLLGFESEFLGMYTASHYDILMPLVLRGDMALLMPSFVAQPYLEAGSLVALDTQWRHVQKYLFVTTRGTSHSPIVRQIRDHARAIGAQLHDSWRNVASRFTEA